MNRSRRVTATVIAATGLLGAAGAAAATVSGLSGNRTSKDDAAVSATALSGRHVQTVAERSAADGRSTLEDYISAMSQRADRLGERVAAAEGRLTGARKERARLIARVRAQTAALARARVATEATSTPTVRNEHSSAPATHTSTGASSGGHGDDGEGGDDGGNGGGSDD
jgi:hypothetical protein